MEPKTYWTAPPIKDRVTLRGRINCDVAIAGGGAAGLSCAYLLSKAGLRCVVLEAGQIGNSATARSTGKLLTSPPVYKGIIKKWDVSVAQAYNALQNNAFTQVEKLAQDPCCLFQHEDSYLFAQTEAEIPLLEAEAKAQQEAGIAISSAPDSHCPLPVKGLMKVSNQAVFDPSAYIACLAVEAEKAGAKLFERSRVNGVEPRSLFTSLGRVDASYLIIATHFPVLNIPGWYFLKMEQRFGVLAAFQSKTQLPGMYTSLSPGGATLRPAPDGFLFGSFHPKVGTRTHAPLEQTVQKMGESMIPGSHMTYAWRNQDCFTADFLPYAGPYSKKTGNIFVASGFGAWGLTGSMMAAQAITGHILGLDDTLYAILSPLRSKRPSFLPLLLRNATVGTQYIAGQFRLFAPRCPHLGCKLRYNPQTHTWDCPCHGSRFDRIGRVMNSPAVDVVPSAAKKAPH